MAELTHYGVHKMFRIEHNIETGEVKEIPLTAEEIAEITAAQELQEAEQAIVNAAREAEAKAKADAKAALLAQLGITEEQAKLLLS